MQSKSLPKLKEKKIPTLLVGTPSKKKSNYYSVIGQEPQTHNGLLKPINKKKNISHVMELHWDYDYYQLWTDNKWMVKEMMVIKDEEDKDNAMNDVSVH